MDDLGATICIAVEHFLSDPAVQAWAFRWLRIWAVVTCGFGAVCGGAWLHERAMVRWRNWKWRRAQYRWRQRVYRDMGFTPGGHMYQATPMGLEAAIPDTIVGVRSASVRTIAPGQAIVVLRLRWWCWLTLGHMSWRARRDTLALLKEHGPAGMRAWGISTRYGERTNSSGPR